MTDDDFLVLHGLRLKGIASAGDLEAAWGLDGAGRCLERFEAEGLCQFRETPRLCGYMLLPAGRERHTALVAAVREGIDPEKMGALNDLYQRFTPLNDDFKELCGRWQVRGGALNDHTDPQHDDECISCLEDLHGRFLPLVARVGRAVAHFTRYPDRFRGALRRLTEEGEVDYFTKPLVDSYHTVWFEFHEDLITTLGRERQSHEA